MRLSARITEPKLWGLTKRDMQDAGRSAIEAAGKLWHDKIKRRHFLKEAVEMYGYRPRTKSYEQKKQREHPEAGRPPACVFR
jgi:hypothetical protein